MSIFSAERFANKYGKHTLKQFFSRCNDGAPLRVLAIEFRMSIPTASRLRKTLMKRQWVLREEVKDYIDFQISYHEGEIDEHRELLEQDSLLKFVVFIFARGQILVGASPDLSSTISIQASSPLSSRGATVL